MSRADIERCYLLTFGPHDLSDEKADRAVTTVPATEESLHGMTPHELGREL